MHSLIDNLIFPAPRASYTPDTVTGRLLYVPKFKIYNEPANVNLPRSPRQASEPHTNANSLSL